jgi:hypothetical protein
MVASETPDRLDISCRLMRAFSLKLLRMALSTSSRSRLPLINPMIS